MPALREQWLAEQLAHKRILSGYGRPIHRHDERFAVALRILAEAGPNLRRAYWVHRQLIEQKGISMNFGAILAAICIDFGIGRAEFDACVLLMFTPGYLGVYADQRARPPLAFLAGLQTRS
jgi:hypothetical protein